MNQKQKLEAIYNKYRRNHKENPDSKQICCMWSTNDPPDVIEGTEPFCEIEEAFGVQIDDDEAFDLYDMNLSDALIYVNKLRIVQEKK